MTVEIPAEYRQFVQAVIGRGRFHTEGEARPELAEDLRSFTVGHHVIYFRSVKGGIQVARVIHGARDITSEF